MAILHILRYPHPNLRLIATPVEKVDDDIIKIVRDMYETMYEQNGVGLAATQVNIQKRIITIDVSNSRQEPLCLINPEIIESEGTQDCEEGCLSFPGIYATVVRAATLRVKALNEKGETFELAAEGLLADCVQHEIDHLNGKVFVDYLSPLKRERLLAKMQKRQREYM